MSPDSPFDSLVEGFLDAKKQMKESVRAVKSDIIHPADPNAKTLTKAERDQDFQDIVNNPARLEGEFLRLRERYNLPDDKPIPRRLVDYLRQGHRESAGSPARPPSDGREVY